MPEYINISAMRTCIGEMIKPLRLSLSGFIIANNIFYFYEADRGNKYLVL